MSYSSSIGDTCYEKLCWIHIHEVADFSTSNYAEFRVGTRKHATKSSTCTKGSRVRPTSRAYGDADPGLVRPTAATAAASVLLLEKVCCRCRTAVVVVVAPAARSSLCWTHVRCRFSVFKLCRISSWGSTKHTANRARVQRVQGLDRQDERTATLTLASCALLLLLLLLPPPRLLPLLTTFLLLKKGTQTSRIHTTAYVDIHSCWFSTRRIRPA